MYAQPGFPPLGRKTFKDDIPVAVIPCATVKQARAVVKMHANLDAKVKDFAEVLSARCQHWASINIYPDAQWIEDALRTELNIKNP